MKRGGVAGPRIGATTVRNYDACMEQKQKLRRKEMFLKSFVTGFQPSIVRVFTSREYSFMNESSL